MKRHRAAGLNQIGPPPRVTNMSQDGYLVHKKPWNKFKRKRDAKHFAAWFAKHPDWKPTPEQLQRCEEKRKRAIVRTAIGNALAQGHAVSTHGHREITLPKLKCLEQEP